MKSHLKEAIDVGSKFFTPVSYLDDTNTSHKLRIFIHSSLISILLILKSFDLIMKPNICPKTCQNIYILTKLCIKLVVLVHLNRNGVSKRKNRDLLEKTRAIILQMNVPKYLRSYGILTTVYLINRLPSRVLEFKSPFKVLQNKVLDISHIKVFGCTCFMHLSATHRDKLDPRASKCIFLGYSTTQKGYKCYDPLLKKLYVSKDVRFIESIPYFTTRKQGEVLSEFFLCPVLKTLINFCLLFLALMVFFPIRTNTLSLPLNSYPTMMVWDNINFQRKLILHLIPVIIFCINITNKLTNRFSSSLPLIPAISQLIISVTQNYLILLMLFQSPEEFLFEHVNHLHACKTMSPTT